MDFVVKNHLLYWDGMPVAQRSTPNKGGIINPSLLVIHYTAGFTAASAISALTNPRAGASAHLVIDRDGTVTQLAPFNVKTWHAGDSAYKGRRMCNGFSIGFELVNCGPVLERADGKLVAEVAPSKEISPTDCIRARHPNGERTPFWQIYPPAQMEATVAIARAVCAAYDIRDIAGHYDIAPKRKRDPGPAFDMISFRSAALGNQDEIATVRIASSKEPARVIEKPRAEITANDLLAHGSRTIEAAGVIKKAVGVSVAAGGAAAGSVASEPREALQQVQTAAQSIAETAQAVSHARDAVSALSFVGNWFAAHWILVLCALAAILAPLAIYCAWRAVDRIVSARVDDARSGVNIGRL